MNRGLPLNIPSGSNLPIRGNSSVLPRGGFRFPYVPISSRSLPIHGNTSNLPGRRRRKRKKIKKPVLSNDKDKNQEDTIEYDYQSEYSSSDTFNSYSDSDDYITDFDYSRQQLSNFLRNNLTFSNP